MARHSTFPIDIVSIDRSSGVPVYRQLYQTLREAILDGRLKTGTRLPASRVLAGDLGISRNTVISTYQTLLSEGFLEARHGSGTFIANLPQSAMRIREQTHLTPLPALSRRGRLMATQPQEGASFGQIAFHPGYPDIRQFPFSIWSRLSSGNLKRNNTEFAGYSMIDGHPRLKSAIAEYLAVSRGVKCDPSQIIVVGGTQAALDLIGRVLLDPGDHFWIEEPGYQGAYGAFLSAGGHPVPVPVSRRGWTFDENAVSPRLIFVTPSCQWPFGAVMQMEDRLRLLELAAARDSWIVEDDYDSEYRFRGRPIPALHGLDNSGRVIYVGTFAKTIFPSLRIGFIVVPKSMAEGFTRALNITGQYPSPILQMTLADFIAQGAFATHLRRMRGLYAKRQRYFAELCRELLSDWLEIQPSDAGIQMVSLLKPGLDDRQVLEAALRRSVRFMPLSSLYHHAEPRQGLVFGYAASDEHQIRKGLRQLRSALIEVEETGR
ncbi:MAG: PLP-dependent aminotransferase family protein [Rhodospirillales bacterium]|nr:PLP-dependent aminotransferase family protein [Rhodospirillales bacterium]